jgi:hypothetical protein
VNPTLPGAQLAQIKPPWISRAPQRTPRGEDHQETAADDGGADERITREPDKYQISDPEQEQRDSRHDDKSDRQMIVSGVGGWSVWWASGTGCGLG